MTSVILYNTWMHFVFKILNTWIDVFKIVKINNLLKKNVL